MEREERADEVAGAPVKTVDVVEPLSVRDQVALAFAAANIAAFTGRVGVLSPELCAFLHSASFLHADAWLAERERQKSL